jgi:ATPase subunit of ABC transporter with duplicated ATPase domains
VRHSFDEHTVLETVIMGNKTVFYQKEMDELYLDYNDKNADRIGELQVQFEEMSGWSVDSDAAANAFKFRYWRRASFTLMADL